MASFKKNLKGIDWGKSGWIINVDPTPRHTDPRPVAQAARSAGVGIVSVLGPGEGGASFPAAVDRLWGHVAQDAADGFLLHLEADWTLTQPVAIETLIAPMLDDPNCYASSLRFYPFRGPKLVLMPSLWRKSFIPIIRGDGLDLAVNPEVFLRHRLHDINKSRPKESQYYNVHYPESRYEKNLIDTGTKWKNKHKLRKGGQGAKDYTKLKAIGR